MKLDVGVIFLFEKLTEFTDHTLYNMYYTSDKNANKMYFLLRCIVFISSRGLIFVSLSFFLYLTHLRSFVCHLCWYQFPLRLFNFIWWLFSIFRFPIIFQRTSTLLNDSVIYYYIRHDLLKYIDKRTMDWFSLPIKKAKKRIF